MGILRRKEKNHLHAPAPCTHLSTHMSSFTLSLSSRFNLNCYHEQKWYGKMLQCSNQHYYAGIMAEEWWKSEPDSRRH